MLKIGEYIVPKDLDQAYELYQKKDTLLLAGGTLGKYLNFSVDLGIELEGLLESSSQVMGDSIMLGSMMTVNSLLHQKDLPEKVINVFRQAFASYGEQLKNTMTLGGSLCARLGTSEWGCLLAAMKGQVVLYKNGRILVAEDLKKFSGKDILLHIEIPIPDKVALYSMRHSSSDAALLCAAVAQFKGEWVISVGARPGRAELCPQASAALKEGASFEEAAVIGASELSFGSDLKSRGEYKELICPVLIRRALEKGEADDGHQANC